MTTDGKKDDERGAPVPLAALLRAMEGLGDSDPSEPAVCRTEGCGSILPPDRYGTCAACEQVLIRGDYLKALKKHWEAMIPSQFYWAKFDSVEFRSRVKISTVDLDKLRSWRGGVLLRGASGMGKTSLAVAKLRQIMTDAKNAVDASHWGIYRRGLRTEFVTALALAQATHEHGSGRSSRAPIVNKALHASVLVLDELGMETNIYKSSAASVLEVMHTRNANQAPMIVTTYLARKDLEKLYGDGIARRLEQGFVINMEN
jgi:DNA replication protein DnaC